MPDLLKSDMSTSREDDREDERMSIDNRPLVLIDGDPRRCVGPIFMTGLSLEITNFTRMPVHNLNPIYIYVF